MSANTPSSTRKVPLWPFILLGALLLLGGAGGWLYAYMHPSSDTVFWSMLEKSLITPSITVQTEQQQDGTTIHRTSRYELGSVNQADMVTTVTQGKTMVKNEVLSTPTTDYLRYLAIETDSQGKDGKPLDFSSMVGVWSKSDTGQAQNFSQLWFGNAVLHGTLSAPQRDSLMNEIRADNVYQVKKATKRKNKETGRMEYVYDVEIQQVPYVRLTKNFSKAVGLHDYDNVDPNMYGGSPAFQLSLVVDIHSRRLTAVEEDGQTIQTYSGYGLPLSAEVPKKAISEDELRSRFAQIQ